VAIHVVPRLDLSSLFVCLFLNQQRELLMNPERKANRFFSVRLIVLFTLSLLLNWPGVAGAQNIFRTQEADIYYAAPSDLKVMESRLSFSQVNNFYQSYVYAPDPAQAVFAAGLAAKVDGLLAKVRQILNFCPKNRERLRIFLLKNGGEVQQRLLTFNPAAERPLFGYGGLEAFYEPRTKTIFLSLSGLHAGILAHEMTHFLLCESFMAPPPGNIQEDWARYVEMQVN